MIEREVIEMEEAVRFHCQWVDVRSPGEYAHAHAPSSVNIPLFDDEQRCRVGTLYKNASPMEALQLGLAYAIDKLPWLQEQLQQLWQMGQSPLLIYCARGGMRSESMARLSRAIGIPTVQLKGGYKALRQWVLKVNSMSYPLHRLSGMTGCGKSALLRRMSSQGFAVIDLEQLAHHRGSVFGAQGSRCSSELFENRLAWQLTELKGRAAPWWVEDESRMIGSCKLPDLFYSQLRAAPCIWIESPLQSRIEALIRDYASSSDSELLAAARTLGKRLGAERLTRFEAAITRGDRYGACELMLSYYDQLYLKSAPVKELRLNQEQARLLGVLGCLESFHHIEP